MKLGRYPLAWANDTIRKRNATIKKLRAELRALRRAVTSGVARHGKEG